MRVMSLRNLCKTVCTGKLLCGALLGGSPISLIGIASCVVDALHFIPFAYVCKGLLEIIFFRSYWVRGNPCGYIRKTAFTLVAQPSGRELVIIFILTIGIDNFLHQRMTHHILGNKVRHSNTVNRLENLLCFHQTTPLMAL